MNRNWQILVVVGIILVVLIVGWDLFLTLAGQKSTFSYKVVPTSSELFGNVEQHLRADPEFSVFEQQARSE
jgi:hypothetical protein